jgi:hypothetical protein
MRPRRLVLLALGIAAMTPLVVSAHPPWTDLHNGCNVPAVAGGGAPPPKDPVVGTLGYFAPLGSFPTPCPAGTVQEWGSHAAPCPTHSTVVGPVPGAYCGPVIPVGGFAKCAWTPVLNTVPTGIVIGWDIYHGNGIPPDGLQNYYVSTFPTPAPWREPWVYGPYPPSPGVWAIPNPYPLPARVIAFPTQLTSNTPIGALGSADVNLVTCV